MASARSNVPPSHRTAKVSTIPVLVRAAIVRAGASEPDFIADVVHGTGVRGRYSTFARANPNMGAAADGLPRMTARITDGAVEAEIWLNDWAIATCGRDETRLVVENSVLSETHRHIIKESEVRRIIGHDLFAGITAVVDRVENLPDSTYEITFQEPARRSRTDVRER